jgi:Fur family ferric uptake transcriptional regulator
METKKLLNNHNLSITQGRLNIMNIFLQSKVGLSEKDIQKRLYRKMDRATIYRTLKIFRKAGIIHPISAEGSATKYVLKKEPIEHLHFKCTRCGDITCLADIEISGFKLPKGYTKSASNFLIIGICNECNRS